LDVVSVQTFASQNADRFAASVRGSRLALIATLMFSAFLNLYRLDQIGPNGFGNTYYAAAIQTMLTNRRHFFYLAFDPAGFLA
jgi:hypothetical protein